MCISDKLLPQITVQPRKQITAEPAETEDDTELLPNIP